MSTQNKLYLNMGPYHEVISGIVLILSISDGVVKVTGIEGTGKSSLLRELRGEFGNEDQQAILFENSPSTVQEIHDVITRELNLSADTSFRKALSRHILSRGRDQQSLIVIFDEAHRLDGEKLDAITKLREIRDNHKSLVSVVLGGDPQLNTLLSQEANQALADDITVSYELQPLTRDQLSQFCQDLIFSRKLKISRPEGERLDNLLAETGGLPGSVIALLINAIPTEETATVSTTGPASPGTVSEKPGPVEVEDEDDGESGINVILSRISGMAKPAAAIGVLAVAAWLLYPQVLPLINSFSGTGTAPEVAAPTPVINVPQQPVENTAAPQVASPEETLQVPDPAELLASAEPQVEPVAETDTQAIPEQTAPDEQVDEQPVLSTNNTPAAAPVQVTATNIPPSPGELETVVSQWLDAWQSQNLDAYFSYYHTDFAPLYQDTLGVWREDRSNSVTNPAAITINTDDFTVTGDAINGISVQFWMNYSSPSYSDRTRKELVLGRDTDGQFRILQEINREVTAPASNIALVAQTPGTATASTGTRTAIAAEPITVGTAAENGVPAVASAQSEEINTFLLDWLTAWQNKDINSYFRHYHPQYKSSSMDSIESWRNDRILKISRPATIHIRLEDMGIVSADDSSSVLRLTMEYHSSFYADRTRKEMQLNRTREGGWQITMEKNTEVVTLPLARLIPENRMASRFTNSRVMEFKL